MKALQEIRTVRFHVCSPHSFSHYLCVGQACFRAFEVGKPHARNVWLWVGMSEQRLTGLIAFYHPPHDLRRWDRLRALECYPVL